MAWVAALDMAEAVGTARAVFAYTIRAPYLSSCIGWEERTGPPRFGLPISALARSSRAGMDCFAADQVRKLSIGF
jgi:hypothetical protein